MARELSTLLASTVLLGMGLTQSCIDGPPAAFENPDLELELRVEDLVSRMTLDEKVSQLTSDAAAIERLGVPKYNWWNECLHGVGRAGQATVFPQAIGMAATWDSELMLRIATVISDEARAKHHEFVRRNKRDIYQGLTFWSPNINIFRDPRWGRGMETYGEDPHLTGQMAYSFIKGLQGNDPKYLKVIATAKHYAVHSGPEPDRHTFNARTSERDLRETYLPHFEVAIRDAGAFSVMCAYNRFEDEACCGSDRLLSDVLREEWGFGGYVVSDCGAIRDIHANHKIVGSAEEAAAIGVQKGCDLNCGIEYSFLRKAFDEGLISEEEITVSVKRLFRARFLLGMFDPPERVAYAQIPYEVVNSAEHRQVALEAARKSIVLLKNEKDVLPLEKDLKTLAVIGPNADDLDALVANYNGDPIEPVTLLEGIRRAVSSETEVLYAFGCRLAENLPDFEVIPSSALFTSDGSDRKPGLKGEYFSSNDFNGQGHRMKESSYPNSGEFVKSDNPPTTPVLTRTDKQIDFNWLDGAPSADLEDDDFGVRWTGFLVPPVSGKYAIGGKGFNAFDIYLDEEKIVSFNNIHHPSYKYKEIDLVAGQSYELKVEFFETLNDSSMQLLWSVPGRREKQAQEAIEVARKADVVIMAMGLSPRLEGEEMKVPVEGFKGGDRLTLRLPKIQRELIRKVARLGKPVVLVLFNGSAVAVNWEAVNVPAIVEAWYSGEAAGKAISDILFGDYNPGGRLPVTFYSSVNQLPPFEDYGMDSKTYRYFEQAPLFPFGYGLSYTSFGYQDLRVPETVQAGESFSVSVEVSNLGQTAGDEVVQLYVTLSDASVPVPIRSLKGFTRIFLEPGERKVIEFELTPEDVSLIDDEARRVVEPGTIEVVVGGKQPGFKGLADASTTMVLSRDVEISGDTFLVD